MFSLFRNNEESSEIQELETELTDLANFNELIDLSYREKVYLFKHSTRCGISSIVFQKFKKKMIETKQRYFFINIPKHRAISNEVSDSLKIRHESPQLIIIKDGSAAQHGSHYALLKILEP